MWQHVDDDLGSHDDLIIIKDSASCRIGIESTVIQIHKKEQFDTVTLLRKGYISFEKICLDIQQLLLPCLFEEREVHGTNASKGFDSPGQLLTHYAPCKETFFIKTIFDNQEDLKGQNIFFENQKSSILIDFHKQFLDFQDLFLKYFDLSPNGNLEEASSRLFLLLREAEQFENCNRILIHGLCCQKNTNLGKALQDRIYRSASGKYICFSF
jgi:hypothetical protein